MTYFFFSKEYHQINASENLFFEFEGQTISYSVQNQIAKVPFRSSFFILENAKENILLAFIDSLKNRAKRIEWVLAPLIYPKAKENFILLKENFFKIKQIELSQYIDLTQDFEKNLHQTKRKNLRKLNASNLVTKQLSLDYYHECYQMIADARIRKNYPVTMQSQDLERLLVHFPDVFLLFGTFIEGILSACSVTVKLSDTVIYQFYWAHNPTFDDKNPLLYHNYTLACLAKKWGFTIFDYGVSTDNGIINRGLFRYKEQLGAKISKKYYLEREI